MNGNSIGRKSKYAGGVPAFLSLCIAESEGKAICAECNSLAGLLCALDPG